MSGRLAPPFFTALDANGNPYSGAKLYFYTTGTSTPKDTYSDAALSTPNANPVVADAGGVFGSIFMSNDAYKVVLKTSADVTVWTADPVRGPFSSGDVSIAGYVQLASANTFTATQTVQLADNGATAGPEIILDRNSSSPAASDRIGNALFRGRDSGGNNETYAELQAAIIDPTDGSEDGEMWVRTRVAGTLADRWAIGGGIYASGLTDPGAGKVNASEVQVGGVRIGRVAQIVEASSAAVATGVTTIPFDNTVPQNTEGNQYLSAAITPKKSDSTLHFLAIVHCSHSADARVAAAIFVDSVADAILTGYTQLAGGGGQIGVIVIMGTIAAGSTSARTYKLHAGGASAGTLTLNGTGGAQRFGGTLYSFLRIWEVLA